MFTFEAHVLYLESAREFASLGWWGAFLMTLPCCFVIITIVLPILDICSSVCGSAADCHLQLLLRHALCVSRLWSDQILVPVAHLCRVALFVYVVQGLLFLDALHVCVVSYPLLLIELDKLDRPSQLIVMRCMSSDVDHPNLQDVPCLFSLVYKMLYQMMCWVWFVGWLQGSCQPLVPLLRCFLFCGARGVASVHQLFFLAWTCTAYFGLFIIELYEM